MKTRWQVRLKVVNFLKKIDDYKMEYGNKSMWAHEYLSHLAREPHADRRGCSRVLTSGLRLRKDVRQLRAEP